MSVPRPMTCIAAAPCFTGACIFPGPRSGAAAESDPVRGTFSPSADSLPSPLPDA